MEVTIVLKLDAHGNLLSLGSNVGDKNVLCGLLAQAVMAAAGLKNGPALALANGPLPKVAGG